MRERVRERHFTLLRVVCHCLSTRSVRALWCSRRALGVPCAVSFVSGVAAPSLHRGRPQSTPSLMGDSERPPTLTTTRSSRLEIPSAVALPQDGEKPVGRNRRPVSGAHVRPGLADALNAPRSASRQTRADGLVPTLRTCFRNGWAGSHHASPASGSDGLVPTVRTWRIFSSLAPLLRSKPPLI